MTERVFTELYRGGNTELAKEVFVKKREQREERVNS